MLKPVMLLEHNFQLLNRKLPARQGFRGLKTLTHVSNARQSNHTPNRGSWRLQLHNVIGIQTLVRPIESLYYFWYNQARPKGQKFRTAGFPYQKWTELVSVPVANHPPQMLLLAGHWMRGFMEALVAASFARHAIIDPVFNLSL
jgi:hypothetical protein